MLTITYLEDGNILLNSPQIAEAILTPGDFDSVKVNSTINCCSEIYTNTQDIPIVDTTKMQLTADGLLIKPLFFGVVAPSLLVKDGVYNFEVLLFSTPDVYSYESNCAFIDVTYVCKVATFLDNILKKDEDGDVAKMVHILHYALVNGSNCGCNCQAMCDVFRELTKLLLPLKLQSQSCGC